MQKKDTFQEKNIFTTEANFISKQSLCQEAVTIFIIIIIIIVIIIIIFIIIIINIQYFFILAALKAKSYLFASRSLYTALWALEYPLYLFLPEKGRN